ncbi:hypothetical protein RSAG8_03551, partial [Rhizoctonia solani AG-8 WAC10335]
MGSQTLDDGGCLFAHPIKTERIYKVEQIPATLCIPPVCF